MIPSERKALSKIIDRLKKQHEIEEQYDCCAEGPCWLMNAIVGLQFILKGKS